MNPLWAKSPNKLGAALTLCLWVLLLSGCASSIEKASLRLEELAAQIEQAAPGGHSEPFGLHDLLRWVRRSPVPLAKDEINDIINVADIDQAESLILPSLSVTPTYGKAAFVLRDDPGGQFKISSAANWDFLRYFESQKSKEFLLKKSDAIQLKKSLAAKQIDLEVTRLYFDYARTLRAQSLAENRNRAEYIRVEMLRMRATINADDRIELEKLTTSYQRSTQRMEAIYARTAWLRRQLLHLCRLPADARIEISDTMPLIEDRIESFGDYLKVAIEQSEGNKIAQISSEVAAENISLTNLGRWTKFSFSSSLLNLLNSVSSSPFILISWTFELFDRGDFDRRMLRAKVGALLAKLDVNDQQIKTIQIAGAAWLSLMDKSADYHAERKDYREAQLDFLAAQQLLKSGALSSEGFQEREMKFKEKTNLLLAKRDDMTLAKAQYLSLISGDSDNWIDRL